MKRRILIALVLTVTIFMLGVLAVWAYIDAVVSVVGTFGAPTTISNDPAVAEPLVSGAPNQSFIQISDDSIITLHLNPCVSVDASTSTSDLIIDTYDQPYPAAAKIEVSQDATTWHEVYERALNDCELTRDYVYDDVCPGLTPGDSTPSPACLAHLDLTSTGLSLACYVRMTDYPGSVDGEYVYPTLGFDLDAIYEGHQRFQDCVPVTVVGLDIKPGSDPNSINLNSKGVVPVAVLTTEDFDASTVDPVTVLFAGASPLRWATEDVDGDGDMDLLFHFKTVELNLDESSTEATLTGTTSGGQYFEGTDTVNVVPPAN